MTYDIKNYIASHPNAGNIPRLSIHYYSTEGREISREYHEPGFQAKEEFSPRPIIPPNRKV